MLLKTIKQIKNFKNKRVLVRVDFNVPMVETHCLASNGETRHGASVRDDSRIRASLPTIEYLLKKKAKVILVSHLGRPEGYDKSLSLNPVAKRLGELLHKNIKILNIKILNPPIRRAGKYSKNIIPPKRDPAQGGKKIFNIQYSILNQYFGKVVGAVEKMKSGEVVMLENIRFFAGENQKNVGTGQALSRQLAELADIFVLDGFAVAHRASASVTGVAKYLPTYAGLLLEKEIEGLSRAIEKPKKPFVLILGGAKMETKLPVVKNLLPKVDFVLIGGGIFNTYLKAKGYKVGGSLVDKEYLKKALKYCGAKKVIKPVDVVIGKHDGKDAKVMDINRDFRLLTSDISIFDVGPKTIRLFASYIKKAQTIVWNGAMGYFEQKPYDTGTLSIARLVASRSKGKAFGIIGGGESLQSMKMVKMSEFVDLASTGGGAMLEFLSGKQLPGVKVVSKK